MRVRIEVRAETRRRRRLGQPSKRLLLRGQNGSSVGWQRAGRGLTHASVTKTPLLLPGPPIGGRRVRARARWGEACRGQEGRHVRFLSSILDGTIRSARRSRIVARRLPGSREMVLPCCCHAASLRCFHARNSRAPWFHDHPQTAHLHLSQRGTRSCSPHACSALRVAGVVNNNNNRRLRSAAHDGVTAPARAQPVSACRASTRTEPPFLSSQLCSRRC
jgi:hypothetical protein